MAAEACFFWGCFGSVSVAFATAYRDLYENGGVLPNIYKRPSFLFIRLMMVLIAGALAVAFGADHPLPAIYTGAAAPLMLDALCSCGPRRFDRRVDHTRRATYNPKGPVKPFRSSNTEVDHDGYQKDDRGKRHEIRTSI